MMWPIKFVWFQPTSLSLCSLANVRATRLYAQSSLCGIAMAPVAVAIRSGIPTPTARAPDSARDVRLLAIAVSFANAIAAYLARDTHLDAIAEDATVASDSPSSP